MRIATLLGGIFALLLSGNTAFSQQLKLGLNPYTVQKSALLELNSTNQGLLLARITDTSLINALTPPDGMVIYFTPTKQLMVRAGGAWQAFTVSGGAITSLNGLTTPVQTFATGTSGTDFNISSAGAVHTFSIPDASATARGLVTTGAQTFAGSKTFSSAPLFSSLTAGSVPYIGTSGLLSENNANLFWDASNIRLGVGTNTPSQKLDVKGTIVASATTYPNYAYNSANRMAFGESNVPANETGSVVQFGSGSNTRNMLFAFTKTNVNTSYFGNDGTQMMLGSEAAVPITFRTGLVYTSANVMSSGTERMRLTSTGNLGIGTSSPSTTLHVVGTNPLTLTGVQAGTSTSADSLLTITSGLVRKIPMSTFTTSGGDITSLNGLTATSQTFATGNAGADFNISSAGSVHTFNIPDASATARGAVTTGAQTIAGSKTFSSAPIFSSLTAGSIPYIGTGGLLSQNNASLFWDATNNRVGIGTASPSTTLHVVGTNPLTLTGVQAGTNTSADSLLTITSGLVRKIPTSTYASASNFWALGGNTVGSVKNFGTVDAFDLPFITGNTEKMRLSSAGNVAIGATSFNATNPEKFLVQAGVTSSFNLMQGRGKINNYLQINVQNDSAGTAASSDLVATSDNGNESVNFIDMGINSSANTSTGVIGGANNAYLYSTGNDFAIGNATASKSLLFFTGGTASEAMRINSSGQVGIGTTSPSTTLHVVGTNPLTLTGVQAGTSTSADSLLTITSGLVRKIPTSTYTSASNFWALGGNTVGALKNFGTVDAFDLPFITGNTERMRLSSTGNLGLGTSTFDGTAPEKLLISAGSTSSYNLLAAKGNRNGYLQFNIQNLSSQGQASTDIVATADNGTSKTSNYVNLGINGSGYNNGGGGILGTANTAYLYSVAQDFVIGNSAASKNLIFFTGGSATSNEAMRINGSGKVGIGTASPSTTLHVVGTNPLTLTGVQAGTSTSADSLLTITSGLVRKVPFTGTYWALGGNTVGSMKSLGTVDAFDLPFITNNTEKMRISSTGNVGIGTSSFDAVNPEKLLVQAGITSSFNLVEAHGKINNYLQLNIQNDSSGTNASSDVVATADNGDESNYFIDMGINSSGNTSTGVIGGTNNAYLYTTGNDFAIGTGRSSKSLIFFTGGLATNERMRIDGTGKVGVNTSSPAAQLDVNGNFKLGSSGTVLTNMFKTSVSITDNTSSITFQQSLTKTVTVTGAVVNASVIVTPRSALANGVGIAYAYVSSANTVTINFTNSGAGILGSQTLGTVTFDITIIQ